MCGSQQGMRTDLERPSSEPKVVAADNGLASVGLPNTDDDTLGTIHCNDGIDGGSSVCSSECLFCMFVCMLTWLEA